MKLAPPPMTERSMSEFFLIDGDWYHESELYDCNILHRLIEAKERAERKLHETKSVATMLYWLKKKLTIEHIAERHYGFCV